MGVSHAPYGQPLYFPSPYTCILAVVAVFLLPVFSVADSCLIDSCWDHYKQASNALKVMYMSEGSSDHHKKYECVAMRTYARCIKDVSHGCLGQIRYHSVQKVVFNHMKMNNCSTDGPIFKPSVHGNGGQSTPAMDGGMCSYKGRKLHRHCGLFGDPHLKTFDDRFQTCRVRGTWPLIRNEYFTVQVTNDPVGKDGTATATSKLTIVIKSNGRCGSPRFITYMAQTDYLPSTFDDGLTQHGPDKSIEVVEIELNRHIEMYIRYIDTKIIIRQVGSFFTFSIKMPEAVITRKNKTKRSSRLQLCVDGCPLRELFNYQEFLSQKFSKLKSQINRMGGNLVMKRVDAAVLCREANVIDFYFDSCVFDLMTTGDRNFTLAASHAYTDAIALYPESQKSLDKRQDFKKYDKPSSTILTVAPSTASTTSALYHLLCLVCLLLVVTTR